MTREELLEELRKAKGNSIIISHQQFHNSKLQGLDLSFITFKNCIFAEIDFYKAQAKPSTFMNCIFIYCDFKGSKIPLSQWSEYDNCEFEPKYSSGLRNIYFFREKDTIEEPISERDKVPDDECIFILEL